MPGLDEHGSRAVGQRSVRPPVARLRAVRVAENVRGTRVAAGAPAAADGRGAGDDAVQAEPVRARLRVPGEPRLSHRPRVQTVPLRARLQGGRSVALPVARRLVRAHTDLQRPEGLREDMPVHQEGHREVPASPVLANTVLLAGRQGDR